MRKSLACVLGCALLLTTLTGCGGSDPETGPSYPPPSYVPPSIDLPPSDPPPTFPTYQVADTECPRDYGIGLSITTDSQAEVEYLDDIVACTNPDGAATYLRNESDAVWRLDSLDGTPGRVRMQNQGPVAASFRDIVGPRLPLMVPGAEVTVDLRPEQIRWDIDLALSVDWQVHGMVAEKIKSFGEEAFIRALKRRSPERAALAQCTLGVDETARDASDLGDADLTDVVLTGLGAAATTNKCRQAAAAVPAVDETGRVVSLTEDLSHLERQTAVFEGIKTRLSHVSSGYKVLRFIKLMHS